MRHSYYSNFEHNNYGNCEQTKNYKFKATVVVEGTVTALNEGDAGELADKELDKIPGFISGQIDNIEAIDAPVVENNLGNDEEATALAAFDEIVNLYNSKIEGMKDYYAAMLTTKLRMFFESK